jgi:hypothetical protein
MLRRVVQTGKKAVYVHLLHGQLVGIGGQHEQVDIIQTVNQFSDILQVFQSGRSLLASVRLIDIESSSPRPCVYSVPTQEDVMLLVLAAEPDL